MKVLLILGILPLPLYATGLQFHDFVACGKEAICFQGKIPGGTEITLLARKRSEACVVKTGSSVQDVTPITSANKCGDLKRYIRGVQGQNIKGYRPLEPKVISDKKRLDSIDHIVRTSALMAPGRQSTMGGLKLSEVNPILDQVKEISANKLKAYVVTYKSEKVSKGGFGSAVRALVINDRAFAIPSKGVPETAGLSAFEINESLFIETESHCGECDSWSGYELFELTNSSVELVHTAYN